VLGDKYAPRSIQVTLSKEEEALAKHLLKFINVSDRL
jgi:hypothetical protein